jgi:ubiquinone/menaquinone biosynthesis C-methylase UbiE
VHPEQKGWRTAEIVSRIDQYWRSSPYEHGHREKLAELCQLYLPGNSATLLEVGCGTGFVYQHLCPEVIAFDRYAGIDSSAAMVARTRANFPRGNFLLADGYHLPFPDGAFDVVVCFEVIGHLANIRDIMSELIRVSSHISMFTIWPTADGAVDDEQLIDGEPFH